MSQLLHHYRDSNSPYLRNKLDELGYYIKHCKDSTKYKELAKLRAKYIKQVLKERGELH